MTLEIEAINRWGIPGSYVFKKDGILPDECIRLVFPTIHVTTSKTKNKANLWRKWPVLKLD